MTDRYATSHLLEDQNEPGSNGTVLRNLPGITSLAEMEHEEEVRFERLMEEAAGCFEPDHCFTASDILWLHKSWLDGVYSWLAPTVLSTSARVASCSQLPPMFRS